MTLLEAIRAYWRVCQIAADAAAIEVWGVTFQRRSKIHYYRGGQYVQ